MPFLPKGAEWIIILIVILLIFGPKNLPKLGSAIGKTVSNLRAGMSEGKKKKQEDAGEGTQTTAGSNVAAIEGEVEHASDEDDGDDAAAVDGESEEAVERDAESKGAAEGDGEQPKVRKVKRVARKSSEEETVSVE